jgi:hypothetical protein
VDCTICRARPPRKTVGPHKRACDVCVHELGESLDLIGDRLPLLRSMLVPGGTPASIRLARDGSPAPLRVDVLALLHEDGDLSILGNLQPYADQLASERKLSGSGTPVTFLREYLEWIVTAEWVGPFARTVRRVALDVRRVVGEAPQPVATCRREVGIEHRIVPGPDGQPTAVEVPVECRGVITASPYADSAVCQRCGDVWERARWQMLGRLQEALP